MGLFSWLFKKNEPAATQPATLFAEVIDVAAIIELPITTVSARPDGTLRIEARGTVDGEDVGLAVELGAKWHAALCRVIHGEEEPLRIVLTEGMDPPPAEYDASQPAGIDFEEIQRMGEGAWLRTGPESDRFVALVARRIDRSPPFGMLPRVESTLWTVDDPAQAMDTPVYVTALFHGNDGARLVEADLNIDIPGRMLTVDLGIDEDEGLDGHLLLRALIEP